MHRLILPVLGLFLAAVLGAQHTHVIPNGLASAPGARANSFPWGGSGSTTAGIRVLACYDSTKIHELEALLPMDEVTDRINGIVDPIRYRIFPMH